MQKPLLPIALGAGLAVAGIAVAAYQGLRHDHAEVVSRTPVVASEQVWGEVLASTPIRELVAVPRQVCRDVTVQQRLPERDGNVGGTIAGAVIGGLIGNQVGGGSGRRAATVAGAIAGGYAGNEIDRRHQGGRTVASTRQQCETIDEAREEIVAWQVSYREPDGTTGELRSAEPPGEQVALGERERVVGYDVTYRHQGTERSVRMASDPGERLPVVDGKVVLVLDEGAPSGG